jgi:hypothetical protein
MVLDQTCEKGSGHRIARINFAISNSYNVDHMDLAEEKLKMVLPHHDRVLMPSICRDKQELHGAGILDCR